MPPPPSGGKAPVRSPERGRGRSGAWLARAGPRQALAPSGRPSARRCKPTQDPSAPTRSGGNGSAPAPAVPPLWPPSAAALAAPDHPFWGWPVQGQSEHGEDRVVRRKTGERSGGRRAACREARKAGGQAPRKGVGADGGGVNPPASPAFSRAGGGEGLAPPSPWSVQRKRAGGEWRDKPLSRRLFRARGRSPVSA